MPLDRSGRRDLARLSLAALLSLVPAAALAAEAPAAPRTAQVKSDEIDAEMLRDLEALNNPNYPRPQDREAPELFRAHAPVGPDDEQPAGSGGGHDTRRAGQERGEVTC